MDVSDLCEGENESITYILLLFSVYGIFIVFITYTIYWGKHVFVSFTKLTPRPI